jgi:uroporphyrin-3 C-methyltransferase
MSEMEQNTPTPDTPPRGKSRGQSGSPKPPRGEEGGARPAPPAAAKDSSRPALILALVAMILAIAMAVTSFFTWREVDRLVNSRSQDLQQAETRSAGLESRLQDTARRIDGIQAEVDRELDEARREQQAALERLEQTQLAVERSVSQLRAQMGRSQDGWLLAEVEYLLRIANQRLQLQGDTGTALAALQAADERLHELSDPGYLAVREALAREIGQLRAVPAVDRGGLALKLASLEARVDALRPAGARYISARERHGEARESLAASDWREVPALVWQAVRRLLVVRTHQEPATPMLPPEQEYFLDQNLRLTLEAARVALLQADAEQYRGSLETARRWLEQHYDREHPATASMSNELFHLLQQDIRPALPDISTSLRLLRQRLPAPEAAAVPVEPPAAQGVQP